MMVCPRHGPHDGTRCPFKYTVRGFMSYPVTNEMDCPGRSWPVDSPPNWLARRWRAFLVWSNETGGTLSTIF